MFVRLSEQVQFYYALHGAMCAIHVNNRLINLAHFEKRSVCSDWTREAESYMPES
jgi:hypothetical protein